MLKVLAKLGLSGSAIAGVLYLGNPLLISITSKDSIRLVNNSRTKISEIKTFDDISLYAKEHGCSFVFSKKWGQGEVYSPEQFVNSEQSDPTKFNDKTLEINVWKSKMIDAVKKSLGSCKEGKTLTFFYYDHRGDLNIDIPPPNS